MLWKWSKRQWGATNCNKIWTLLLPDIPVPAYNLFVFLTFMRRHKKLWQLKALLWGESIWLNNEDYHFYTRAISNIILASNFPYFIFVLQNVLKLFSLYLWDDIKLAIEGKVYLIKEWSLSIFTTKVIWFNLQIFIIWCLWTNRKCVFIELFDVMLSSN